MIRSANRRARRFLTDTPNINLILGLIAIGLIMALGLPQAFPILNQGAICTNLPAPKGGNSRSLLALSNEHQKLELDVEVLGTKAEGSEDVVIGSGSELVVRLTFDNRDIGPIMLYYRVDREVVGSFSTLDAQTAIGVIFEIRSVGSDIPVSDNLAVHPITPQRSDFTLEELYILPAATKCFIEFHFTPERLAQMGVGQGEYRIRAYYRNRQPGIYIPPTPSGNNPIPTAMFTDQGVWIGTVQSDEDRFRIQ